MTDFIVIGSSAIQHWLPSFREPADIDIASRSKIEGYDCILMSDHILKHIPNVFVEWGYGSYAVATLDAVYTIKMSHLPYDVKWLKHKQDVLFLKARGCKIIEPLYTMLCNYWKETNGDKPFLSLYKKKTDFFDDYVTKVYNHDWLHEVVAHPNKPVYTLCLKDGEEVAIDKAKFDALPVAQQLRMFREEICVISIERWLVNPKCCGKYSWFQAYFLALHKTVTALTKDWASRFIVENIDYYNVPDFEYFRYALQTLKEGEKIMGGLVDKAALLEDIAIAWNMSEHAADYGMYLDVDEPDDFIWYEVIEESKVGCKVLDSCGGIGCGSNYWIVFTFQGKTYKAQTWYASQYGVEWYDMEVYEVEAKQKTVTVYE